MRNYNKDSHDCQIAGTILANNVSKILTMNRKHFERIKEIKIIDI